MSRSQTERPSGARHALLTGGAGFIGSHLADRLLADGWRLTVVDNFDPFYDPAQKRRNVEAHRGHPRYTLVEADIRDLGRLRRRLHGEFDAIIHLAALAGVRPSLDDPFTYQAVNCVGTQTLLEFARERGVRQFIFASSSSVYGANPRLPWNEADRELLPLSPYAASKLSAELIGHVHSHLYGIRFIALRLFTVYGPRQRPDLAIHKFARLMLAGTPVPIYGDGTSQRDYTYVDDVVAGFRAALAYDRTCYEAINLGSGRPVSLREAVGELEAALGVRARLHFEPPRPGDAPRTLASVGKAARLLGYQPRTGFREGIRRFVASLHNC